MQALHTGPKPVLSLGHVRHRCVTLHAMGVLSTSKYSIADCTSSKKFQEII